MRIALCPSEGAPYVRSGGLGDVMEALPAFWADATKAKKLLEFARKSAEQSHQR